jgi:hypothetical protein
VVICGSDLTMGGAYGDLRPIFNISNEGVRPVEVQLVTRYFTGDHIGV